MTEITVGTLLQKIGTLVIENDQLRMKIEEYERREAERIASTPKSTGGHEDSLPMKE